MVPGAAYDYVKWMHMKNTWKRKNKTRWHDIWIGAIRQKYCRKSEWEARLNKSFTKEVGPGICKKYTCWKEGEAEKGFKNGVINLTEVQWCRLTDKLIPSIGWQWTPLEKLFCCRRSPFYSYHIILIK